MGLGGDIFEDARARAQLHRAIAKRLGLAIVAGQFAPGDILATEFEGSRALGVSRSAYREAICILQAKGLVDSRRKVGTWVNVKQRWSLLDPEVLAWSLAAGSNQALVQDLIELRLIVAPHAAALAATRRTDLHLEALRRVLIEAEQRHGPPPSRLKAARDFHDTVFQACGNDALIAVAGVMGVAADEAPGGDQDGPLTPDRLARYWRVFDAIAGRDCGAARQAMIELVRSALEGAPSAIGEVSLARISPDIEA